MTNVAAGALGFSVFRQGFVGPQNGTGSFPSLVALFELCSDPMPFLYGTKQNVVEELVAYKLCGSECLKIGPKQTCAAALHMSTIGSKADMTFCDANVRPLRT